jgi:hypothetical protein
MKRWLCMDCRSKVEIDRHGRCGTCDSEAVILAGSETELSDSVSMGSTEAPLAQVSA